MHREKIFQVLDATEKELLGLLGDAAAKGDYEAIDLARSAAEQVRDVRSRIEGGNSPSAPGGSASSTKRKRKRSAGIRKTRGSGKKHGSYPRFEIAEDGLVKIGWSKKKSAEYTQRIPREAFDQVVSALDRIGANGGEGISSDVILETVDERSDEHIPSYQTYGVIRFLRDQDVVRQIRRGEYSLPEGIGSQARHAWATLEGAENG